jgi:hypothetical protein
MEESTVVASPGKRRTDRVTASIRLLVSGNDALGSSFFEETSTIVVSLHGASIILRHRIVPNAEVSIRNIATGAEADMQIIGQVSKQPEGYHYALRFLNATDNIWGIDFPPLAQADEAAGKVLLVCAECRSSAVVYLNEFELEVFEGQGSITFPCKRCGGRTSWILSQQEVATPIIPAPPPAEDVPKPAPVKAEMRDRRRNKRVSLKMKACIRTDKFGEEEVLTENVSKGGFAFKSSHKYDVSMQLEVSLPFSHGAGNIFSLAKIARQRPLPTGGWFAYGVCYLRDVELRADPASRR